jgi:pSer/pThr/pTyr-binding forkhead associated (FHA) protein
VQTITEGLSAPRVMPEPAPKAHADDKWAINIFSVKVDLRVLIGILVGILALVGAYILSKRPADSTKPASPPPPPPPRSPPDFKAAPPDRAASKRSRTSIGYAFPAPSQGHPAAILRCLGGPAKGQQYSIEQATYRIGSGEGNELRLSDDYLSRKHASVQYDSGSLYLNDNGSRNGTFLNDMQLDQTARALSPGDRIRVGKSTLEVLGVSSQGYPQTSSSGDPLVS